MFGNEESEQSEPMTVHFDKGVPSSVFVYTFRQNRLCDGLSRGQTNAHATFASKDHDFFASLRGTLSVVEDQSLIDRYWSDSVASWYDGGRDDPDLRLLGFAIEDMELWQVDLTIKGTLKVLVGMGVGREDVGATHARIRSS